MIALPAPQRSTVPMVLSARWEAPLSLGPNGPHFDFGALDPVQMVNVSSGFLYRILSYSFALEIPENAYLSSLLAGAPLSWNLVGAWNHTAVMAKPVVVSMYQKDARFLQYFNVPQGATQLDAVLSGDLDASSVELIGYASIVAQLSISVQCISDDQWLTKYERGEM